MIPSFFILPASLFSRVSVLPESEKAVFRPQKEAVNLELDESK